MVFDFDLRCWEVRDILGPWFFIRSANWRSGGHLVIDRVWSSADDTIVEFPLSSVKCWGPSKKCSRNSIELNMADLPVFFFCSWGSVIVSGWWWWTTCLSGGKNPYGPPTSSRMHFETQSLTAGYKNTVFLFFFFFFLGCPVEFQKESNFRINHHFIGPISGLLASQKVQ